MIPVYDVRVLHTLAIILARIWGTLVPWARLHHQRNVKGVVRGSRTTAVIWNIATEKPLILSLPRMINFKFSLQPHQKYYIRQSEELCLSHLTQMKDDYTIYSHYLTYAFLFQRLGECTFWTWGWKGHSTADASWFCPQHVKIIPGIKFTMRWLKFTVQVKQYSRLGWGCCEYNATKLGSTDVCPVI